MDYGEIENFFETHTADIAEHTTLSLNALYPIAVIVFGLILAVFVIEIIIDLINEWRGKEKES